MSALRFALAVALVSCANVSPPGGPGEMTVVDGGPLAEHYCGGIAFTLKEGNETLYEKARIVAAKGADDLARAWFPWYDNVVARRDGDYGYTARFACWDNTLEISMVPVETVQR